jgi:menaquinone-dependent protoporphyrinogen oxidase
MKPILVLYATREGQTRRIAEHVAATISARGLTAEVEDAATIKEPFDLGGHAAAVLAGSVHDRKHERELEAFVMKHRDALQRMPAAFLSVSLAEAAAESQAASRATREAAAAGVERLIDMFFEETGWHPEHVKPVAGALAYTRYGALTRLAMKLSAKITHLPTDTRHDHELTDWVALDRFVDEIVASIPGAAVKMCRGTPDAL